jgi:NAD(P)H dehydrogenase (quinone)
MNHLVVVAHPREASFTKEVARIYVEEVEGRGHTVVVRDLYRLNFNPVSSVNDLVGFKTGTLPDDVKAEHEHIRAADTLAFIAPVWWISTPAILKGYIDRVFTFGFAYGYGPDGLVRGYLAGKRGLVFSSSGSTEQEFTHTGKLHAIRTQWGVGTIEFCAIDLLEHVHFAPVGSRSTPQMVEGYFRRVRETVAKYF